MKALVTAALLLTANTGMASQFMLTAPLIPIDGGAEQIQIMFMEDELPVGKTRSPYSANVNRIIQVDVKPKLDKSELSLELADGALPRGLTFDSATGVISGTPTLYAMEPYEFTIRAAYKDVTQEARLKLKIEGHTYLSQQLRVGDNGACARAMDGIVHCWGSNTYGQLGIGNTELRTAATRVTAINEPVKDFMTGWYHNCVITMDDKVKCWGRNSHGQTGVPKSSEPQYEALEILGLRDKPKELSAGNSHGCALLIDNTVQCWGRNQLGQLGDGTTVDSHTPVEVQGLTDVDTLVVGEHLGCAIRKDRSLWCWGNNSQGQLGLDPQTKYRATAAPVPGLTANIASIDVGWQVICAVTTSGEAKCIGDGRNGNRGDGTQVSSSVPTMVYGMSAGVSRIHLGQTHTCAVMVNGSVYCWGQNEHHQAGQPDADKVFLYPQLVPISGHVKQLALGYRHSCVELDSYEIQCWGINSSGQLGNGSKVASHKPQALIAN